MTARAIDNEGATADSPGKDFNVRLFGDFTKDDEVNSDINSMLKTNQMQIRDPYIVRDDKSKKYYMYGTTDKNCWGGPGTGFDTYVSSDLENWEGPIAAFRPEENFWGEENFWAPEVHEYKNKYYMFATFKNKNKCRGTAVLISNLPQGPFVEHSDGAVTPADWECLDGTLFVDDEGTPWMVFCHEWQQTTDGTICAAKMSDDLSRFVEEPVLLFKASDSGWAETLEWEGKQGIITDGPCFFYHDNNLVMLWSSFIGGKYAIGAVVSEKGVLGPWKHIPEPMYVGGGHCMVFETFEGKKMLSFHQPNDSPNERPVFLELDKYFDL